MTHKESRKLHEKQEAIIEALMASGMATRRNIPDAFYRYYTETRCVNPLDALYLKAKQDANQTKQRMRADGRLEIGNNGDVKPPSDLDQIDREAITIRRRNALTGRLREFAKFLRSYGDSSLCSSVVIALAAIDNSIAAGLDADIEAEEETSDALTD